LEAFFVFDSRKLLKRRGIAMVKRKERQAHVGIWSLVGIFVLVMFTLVAQAEEPIDFTQYASCRFTQTAGDKESMFGNFECTGVTRSNQENKVFEKMSLREVGFFNNVGGQTTAYSYTTYTDGDGDFVIMEFRESGPTEQPEGTWKILYGTGKWKGINGSGKHVHVSRGKPIKPDTVQGSVVRNTGTFELPK
jgi:hypothetical protein